MSKTFLKIKIMSLAAEAKIIRTEANKWPRAGMQGIRFELHCHRRFDVRSEARSAQLAYGYLRGRPYRRIEAKCWDTPSAQRIAELIAKFGGVDKKQAPTLVRAWLDEKIELAKAA